MMVKTQQEKWIKRPNRPDVSKSFDLDAKSIKIQDIAIIIQNHRFSDLTSKHSGRLLSDPVNILRDIFSIRNCQFVHHTRTTTFSMNKPIIPHFVIFEFDQWFSMMMSDVDILDFEWFFKMIKHHQSGEMQIRMEKVVLVRKNTSRRSRNVHRVAQKPPRMYPSQI